MTESRFAGPFGIEEAVAAAGILPTIIALLLLPLIWGLPQALMVRAKHLKRARNSQRHFTTDC